MHSCKCERKLFQKGTAMRDFGPLFKENPKYQSGYGRTFFPRRRYFQNGRGFGSIFTHLARYLSPLLVKGLKNIGKEAISAGSDILENKSEKSFKELMEDTGKKSFKNLKRKAMDKLESIREGFGPLMITRHTPVKRKLPIKRRKKDEKTYISQKRKTKKKKKNTTQKQKTSKQFDIFSEK